MKVNLRDHPFLSDQNGGSWPPAWVWTGGEKGAIAAGEVGILHDVKTHDALSSKCYLFIEHNGATFIGRLACESSALCQEMVEFLRQHRGKPLRSIGGLGIDLTDMQTAIYGVA